MGNPTVLSSCIENVRSKRMTPLSYLKAYARRFSCGQEPCLDAKMGVQGSLQTHRAFIALGSNVGDRVEMIERACLELDRANIKVKRTSSLFETTPMYVLEQGTFINGVCEVNPPLKMTFFLSLLFFAKTNCFRLKQTWRPWSFWMPSSLLRMH